MDASLTQSDDRAERARSIVEEWSATSGEFEPRVEFVSLDRDGIVQVRIPGTGCCLASALPWIQNLERRMQEQVPGIRLVEVVP